ncbi:hypothetical protein [Amycolatopsis sp. CA-230715]|uniref:hypothetical protein n=1 Tax=Amycolatopsis sp. CA-230715 TaxID=2745196 RepID=UPI001C00F652|nr:hypothetical protein [Amycolatopsis sp. CA-230715]QWF85882.1 hypothetical protein HUW46_09362 [Amycolatopsis sp. CA-230715]
MTGPGWYDHPQWTKQAPFPEPVPPSPDKRHVGWILAAAGAIAVAGTVGWALILAYGGGGARNTGGVEGVEATVPAPQRSSASACGDRAVIDLAAGICYPTPPGWNRTDQIGPENTTGLCSSHSCTAPSAAQVAAGIRKATPTSGDPTQAAGQLFVQLFGRSPAVAHRLTPTTSTSRPIDGFPATSLTYDFPAMAKAAAVHARFTVIHVGTGTDGHDRVVYVIGSSPTDSPGKDAVDDVHEHIHVLHPTATQTAPPTGPSN